MKKILVFTVLFFVSLQTIAFTQTVSSDVVPLPQNDQCLQLQQELKLKEKLLSDNYPELNAAFDSLITSLTDISVMLQNRGIDTTALDKHALLLKAKFTKLKSDRQTYHEGIKLAQSYNCDLRPSLLSQEITKLKNYSLNVKSSVADLSNYFTEVILKDLQELRSSR